MKVFSDGSGQATKGLLTTHHSASVRVSDWAGRIRLGTSEVPVRDFEQSGVRHFGTITGQDHQRLSVAFLNSVAQHWTVDFSENILPDFHHHVRPDSEDVGVISGMVNFTKGQSVHH